MREFTSIRAFLRHLDTLPASVLAARHMGLQVGAKTIQDEARAEIGHYQSEAGPFAAWAPLADATRAERARLGFPEDYPLLRSGALLHAVDREVDGNKAIIGVKDAPHPDGKASIGDIAVWQELGTDKIPPRSFLGGAAVRTQERVVRQVVLRFIDALCGRPARNR